MSDAYDFVVKRDDLREGAILPAQDEDAVELETGQVLLRIDNFSISANNVTYGVMGDAMNYWKFFPADNGWGSVPAWGFAEAVRSESDLVPAGTRIYGYLPMSTHLVITPGELSERTFTDVAAHRDGLPAVYNRYTIVQPTPDDPDREPLNALFTPLFATSFLLEDELREKEFFGASKILFSSASSKTALGFAFLVDRDRPEGTESIGLTSAGNREFVEETGLYDRVITYDDLTDLEPLETAIYVDFGGNADLRAQIHGIYDDQLKASVAVGVADWEALTPPAGGGPLPGPSPELFFAPTRAEKRIADWGGEGLWKRVSDAQDQFIDSTGSWLNLRRGSGPDELEATFQAHVEGQTSPDEGWSIRP